MNKKNNLLLTKKDNFNQKILDELDVSFPDDENSQIIYKLDSIEFYTSLKLKRDVLEIVSQTPLGNRYKNILKKYFDNNIIVPTRYSKKYFQHLFFKTKVFFLGQLIGFMSNLDRLKSGLGGFYCQESKRIYLVMDNMVDIFNNSMDEKIIQLIIHELSHYASLNSRSSYLAKTKKIMLNWYFNFFLFYLELDAKLIRQNLKDFSNSIQKFYLNAINFESQNIKDLSDKKFFIKYIKKQHDLLSQFSKLTKLDEKKFEDKVTNFAYIVTYCFLGMYHNAIILLRNDYSYFHSCLDAYSAIETPTKKINDTFFYQEFFFPSEILAVSSINEKNADTYMKLL